MKIQTDPNIKASKKDEFVPYFIWKRIFDLCLSIFLLIAISPVFIVIFLVTKLEGSFNKESKGQFFYTETRISHGKPFRLYKIRIFKISALNKVLNQSGFIHTKPLEKNPANLTFVGKILKKLYLDESAQLLNILKGEMSFVGTRPWNTVDYEKEISKGIFRKKIIKAGLTGLVQITKGKHKFYPAGDLGLDDYYINFCKNNLAFKIFIFDLKIIFLSILKTIKGQGL